MDSLETIYEQQVLLENRILEWIKKHKNLVNWIKDHVDVVKEAFLSWVDKHGGMKQVIGGGIGAFTVGLGSPATMAIYFHNFFQKNPETLDYPVDFLKKVSEFIVHIISNYPDFLKFLEKI